MKTIGVIPCRYKSQRFPGKPLADILGKPMMWHVYQQAKKCPLLDAVYIATDDDRIEQACRELSLDVLRTRDDHVTGTDRVAECAERVEADIYVNVQGDEPMIEPGAISAVAAAIVKCTDSRVVASNAYTPFVNPADVIDVNNVKVVLAMDGSVISYSRLPVPYPKGTPAPYYRQLGLYAFRRSGLRIFAELSPGPVEAAEGVEMLRFVEHGHRVLMVEVEDKSIPVDTPSDLERVRALMRTQSA